VDGSPGTPPPSPGGGPDLLVPPEIPRDLEKSFLIYPYFSILGIPPPPNPGWVSARPPLLKRGLKPSPLRIHPSLVIRRPVGGIQCTEKSVCLKIRPQIAPHNHPSGASWSLARRRSTASCPARGRLTGSPRPPAFPHHFNA